MDLKKERIKNGYSQEDVAKAIGMAQTTYSKKERGDRLRFNEDEITKIKNLYSLTSVKDVAVVVHDAIINHLTDYNINDMDKLNEIKLSLLNTVSKIR